MNAHADHLLKLLTAISHTEEEECDCGRVYAVLDQVVEIVQAGGDLAEFLPDVAHHLELCGCCRAEYKLLYNIITKASLQTEMDDKEEK